MWVDKTEGMARGSVVAEQEDRGHMGWEHYRRWLGE